jgi:hypothetical protein
MKRLKGKIMTAKELFPLIKAKGKGDRLSENFMKWVKRWGKDRPTMGIEVVFLHWSNIDGSHVDHVAGTTQPNHILIGRSDDEGWFYGARLSQIIGGKNGPDVYAFPPSLKTTPLPDWMQGYIEGGKCFIDPEHRLYMDKERWQYSEDGNTRRCQWCGNFAQTKRVEPRTVFDTFWDGAPC